MNWWLLLIAVDLLVLGYLWVASNRNHELLNYWRTLIDEVHTLAMQDIAAGRDFRWRYDVLDAVSYDAMAWKVWRSFDSFFPDQSFRKAAS